MSYETFINNFSKEHRKIRDILFRLKDLFREGNTEEAREALGKLDGLTGPHFRYEEESLYPALVDIFGEDYIDELLIDHDGAIRAAARISDLAEKEILSEEERAEAVDLVRSMLPHVSDCEGLSVMIETMGKETVETMEDARERAFEEELGLLEWARTVRDRELAV